MTSVWVGKTFGVNNQAPPFEAEFFGANHIATTRIHPVPGIDPECCVETGEGLWKDKIYHFKPDLPPSSGGDEIQTEYFVPSKHCCAALRALWDRRNVFSHLVQVTELRMVAADDLPMRPCRGQECVGIHFTWRREFEDVLRVLPEIENVLEDYDAKPHFGKLFAMNGQRFGELFADDLVSLRERLNNMDPTGKFRNHFMDTILFDEV